MHRADGEHALFIPCFVEDRVTGSGHMIPPQLSHFSVVYQHSNRTEVSRIRSVNNWISVCSLLIRSPFWIIFNLFPHVFLLSQRCKVCPLTFLTKSEMQIHSKSHTEAKPHKCPHCSKTFANASYLSQHLRIHLGIKPYHCSYCENSFRQLSHLQQHTR